ncbi:MAG TPA: ankyrin repeat domain-containing protein, partial [Phenylobacterium sp.]|nr:ankyrin repeat domain-containing protein [Phenylobacterium sp.]
GHVETVRELLTTAIDVNHVNRLGWTALLEVVILGDGGASYIEITRLLLAHGADVNLPDNQGVTPLGHARQRGQREIASILEAAGARILMPRVRIEGVGDLIYFQDPEGNIIGAMQYDAERAT